MSAPAKLAQALGAGALLLGLLAPPAGAEPILDLQLTRTHAPANHSDERLAYEIDVANSASPNPSTGTELSCEGILDTGNPTPTVEIEWLRSGTPIPGSKGPAESADTYVVGPADAGKSIQCLVTATNDPDGAGGAYAPISAVGVSRPPVWVEPVPSPAPPSGTSLPGTTGEAPATPSGTATVEAGSNVLTNVITAIGSGDLVAGSKVVTDVKATTGVFISEINKQTVVGPGIPAGTIIAKVISTSEFELSNAASATSGDAALEAGPQPFVGGQKISGAGIPPGTTITNGSGLDLTLSSNATESGAKVPITATSTTSCTAPSGWTGSGLTWSFQWLRNGAPIPGATSAEYVAQSADTEPPSIIQCLARAKAAAGNEAVAISATEPTRPRPQGSFEGPPANNNAKVSFNNKTEGPVTFEAELPEGTQALRVAGTGWSCAKTPQQRPRILTCAREDSLAPGLSYPKIELIAQVLPDAADELLTKASVSGGGAVSPASDEDTLTGIAPAVPFGFKSFETMVLDSEGEDFKRAGGHPFSAGAVVELNDHVRAEESAEAGLRAATGSVRVIKTDVPPGFVGNPEALAEKCETVAEVITLPPTCPVQSAVGGIRLETEQGTFTGLPIFAIEPEAGTPAQFAFGVAGVPPGFAYTLTPELRPGDGYAVSLLTAPIQKYPELFGAKVTLCGFGAKLGPNVLGNQELEFKGCRKADEPEALERPFMSLPTKCGDPESTTTEIFADTWEEPGSWAQEEHTLPELEGCDQLAFSPTLKARPTSKNADSPTGLEVDLQIPQSEDPEGSATAHLRKAVVSLPEGLVVNPSGANGLGACSEAQLGMKEGVPDNSPVKCPNASKIGSVQVSTPILDHPLPGALYVATPHENPFDSLIALYLVVDSPKDGITIKLAGKTEANPATGQLTSTFDQNPEAPVERVELKLRSGASAPLRTPATCGKYTTTSSLTPWSAPDSGPPATPKDSWQINRGPSGGACASIPPNAPSFEAGTASAIAGAHSPFVLKLSREDASQEFAQVSVSPPPGLLAKLAGTSQCSDASLEQAKAKSGRQEQASPSCPPGSELGSVIAAAGAGPAPFKAPGKAYLAGPYKGAPLSIAILTPALAGPFDLGVVVVRAAAYVNSSTAQITVKADPLPRILEGIPLDVRSATVSIDRPNFTLNPTSCDPMAVTGELLSTLGQSAPLFTRFQVAECSRLAFKPKLRLKLKGKTKRGDYQGLTATLTAKPGEANIASASVTLPRSAFLAQEHIRTICTRVQFAAEACPKGSIYGRAKAITPLLAEPLRGPVYLRSSDNELPDLVVALKGPDSLPVEIELAGRTDSKRGALRNTFDLVPDAPVSKFTLELFGGRKGLVVNSRDLCGARQRASVAMTGQNGKEWSFRPVVGNGCGKARKRTKPKRRR